MAHTPEGITFPPIDDLLAVTDSKYELVIQSSRRARQINSYYAQLQEGLLENVGPLVTPEPNEKPLSIALREIDEGLLTIREVDEAELAAADAPDPNAPAPLQLGDDAPEVPGADLSF